MMKNNRLFPVTITILMVCLGVMVVNWLIVPLPDWSVRSFGLLMLADRIKISKTINKKKGSF